MSKDDEKTSQGGVASQSRAGGSYTTDPQTGELTLTEWTELTPTPQAEPTPADKKKVK